MRNALFTLLIITAFSLTAKAQDFKSAIGLRLGSPVSVSYKTFLNETAAAEAFVGFRNFGGVGSWINVGAAYQIHKDIGEVENLQWYYGGGASVFLWSFDSAFIDDSSVSFGLQGYLGLSYTLENTPLNFSVDWVPTFFLGGYGSGFGGGYGALSVRYVLNR